VKSVLFCIRLDGGYIMVLWSWVGDRHEGSLVFTSDFGSPCGLWGIPGIPTTVVNGGTKTAHTAGSKRKPVQAPAPSRDEWCEPAPGRGRGKTRRKFSEAATRKAQHMYKVAEQLLQIDEAIVFKIYLYLYFIRSEAAQKSNRWSRNEKQHQVNENTSTWESPGACKMYVKITACITPGSTIQISCNWPSDDYLKNWHRNLSSRSSRSRSRTRKKHRKSKIWSF